MKPAPPCPFINDDPFSFSFPFQPKKFNEKKIKKKDLIHPRSRKADQVNRAKLRKQKLEGAHEKLMLRKNATGM